MSLFREVFDRAPAVVPYPWGFDTLYGVERDGALVIYAATLSGGGVAVYRVSPEGVLGFTGVAAYPDLLPAGASPTMAALDETLLVSGAGARILLGPDGAPATWSPFPAPAALVGGESVVPGRVLAITPEGHTGYWSSDTLAFDGVSIPLPASAAARIAGYVAFAFPEEDRIEVFSPDLTETTAWVGAAQGVGIDRPLHIDAVEIDGASFLVVGSFGSSSLTVISVSDSGTARVTDHVLDSLNARFKSVTGLDVAVIDGKAVVVATGGDHGMSALQLLPNGRLVHLGSVGGTFGSHLMSPTDVVLHLTGKDLQAVVSSEREAGLGVFAMPLSDLPTVRMGTSGDDTVTGDASADILWDGAGSDALSGGAGADIFVFAADGRLDRILDFERGADRIDLSGLPRVYSIAAAEFAPTETGARLTVGSETIVIETKDGRPLDRGDLLDTEVFALDRPPMAQVGFDLVGTDANDDLAGGDARDRLRGGGGDDTLQGGAGADLILGGTGRDTIDGGDGPDGLDGGGAADAMAGGPGGDLMFGGGGDDVLAGGSGADVMSGGAGADGLDGGADNDVLRGNADGDDLSGGDGVDLLFGGDGDDRLSGDAGDDWLSGGEGADVFVFAPGGGADIVTDFRDDLLDFRALADLGDWQAFRDASITAAEHGALIDYGTGTVLLEGVDPGDLAQGDFLF